MLEPSPRHLRAVLVGALVLALSVPVLAQEGPPEAVAVVQASFEALRAAPSYRMTMTIESPELEQSDFDFPPMVTEVAGDRKRTAIDLDVQKMDLHVASVTEPGRVASRLDSAYLTRMKREMDQASAQAIQQQAVGGIMGWIQGAFDPFSLVTMAIGFAVQKVAQRAVEKQFQLGKWKCHDLEPDEGAEGSIALVEPLGEESLGGERAHAYRVVMKQGSETLDARLWTDGEGGLPRRMAFETEEGSMTIDYSDYGAPIEITFPECED